MAHRTRADRGGTLLPVSYDSPDARALTRALHREQKAVYGRADDPEASEPAEFTPPKGAFFVIRAEGAAVACGGWRTVAETVAEIKRMYVSPTVRGLGLGHQLLAALESDARRHGMTELILETGVANTAALALYSSRGYAPIAPYAPDRDPRVNRALRKALIAEPVHSRRPSEE
ncbi:GNAT family N-acetyltransferase [Streptomyces sp. BBFR102]|uniref:GNAT family N-acetyltransferase n=1 Tax=Streptomyces sp. BBFR102 TaxID=3448171 RepID=UPI003F52D33D